MDKFLSKLRKKNKKAKAELYKGYGKKLYGYAITKWKVSEDDAWELVYKTLDRTLETFEKYTFESEAKFASFIFRIFINYLKNHYRDTKNKVIETVRFEDNNDVNTTDDNEHIEEKEDSILMRLLKEELSELEDWQRILLLMRAQNYSYNEIAQYIDKPVEQLKVYHMRYKQKIIKNINAKIKDVK